MFYERFEFNDIAIILEVTHLWILEELYKELFQGTNRKLILVSSLGELARPFWAYH